MTKNNTYLKIPWDLTEQQFSQFSFPHLSVPTRGRKPKLSNFKILRYILIVLYTGIQWSSLPIEIDETGEPEIHYTNVFR